MGSKTGGLGGVSETILNLPTPEGLPIGAPGRLDFCVISEFTEVSPCLVKRYPTERVCAAVFFFILYRPASLLLRDCIGGIQYGS